MFSELAGKAAESFGRAYVYAGLLPALLLIFGIRAVTGGDVVTELDALLDADGKGLTKLGIATLLVSVIFALSRETIVSFFEDLPGRVLAPVRYWLTRLALRKRARIDDRIARGESEFSAVRWLIPESTWGNQGDPYVGAAVPQQDWESVRHLSEAGRNTVIALRDRAGGKVDAVAAKAMRVIGASALALYAFSARHLHDRRAAEEELRWKTLFESAPSVPLILSLTSNHIQRELVAPVTKKKTYPDGIWVKPTRIGNILSALDDYAKKRYGMPTYLLWRRLWWVLPDKHREEIGAARVVLEGLLCSTLAVVIVAVWAGLCLLFKLPWLSRVPAGSSLGSYALALTTIAAVLASVVPYRLALTSSLGLTQKVTALVDLHRLSLLKAIRSPPANAQEEFERFDALKKFWNYGEPRPTSLYAAPDQKPNDDLAT